MDFVNYRNPEDKKRLIKKIEKLYLLQSDIRLCQLLSNLFGTGPHDLFFIYDDQLEKIIDEELKIEFDKTD